MSFYNVFLENQFGEREYLLALDESQLTRVVDAYLNGEVSVNVKGAARKLMYNTKFIIYSITALRVEDKTQEEIVRQMNADKLRTKSKKISLQIFRLYGANVSDDFTGGKSYGEIVSKSKMKMEANLNDRIFVSHSSKNKGAVNKFCDLVLHNGLNIDPKRIFNTSLEGSKPKTGQDFRLKIKEELKNAKLVLQFISRDYKKSEVCLNEMGAAWVLSDNVKPLIMEKDEYEVGFIHSTTQQVQLHSETDLIRFADELVEEKIIMPYTGARLNEKIKEFIEYINSTKVEKEPKTESKPIDVKAAEENPFFLINAHSSCYYFKDGFFRVIPDELTKYYLDYANFDSAQKIILNDSQLKEGIGKPMSTILSGEIWMNGGKVWLVFEAVRRHVLNNETFECIRKANSKISVMNVNLDKLLSLSEGDVFDVKGKIV